MTNFDLAVVGSAFGGSLTAMIAQRLGCRVVLIERGRHPRFAIGESSTPLANLLLDELAVRYDLPRLRPLTKWGSWQRQHPEIGAGLKRGFTFYHHDFGKPWEPRAHRHNELLVAASPRDEIADTHWYRPDFDHFFVRQAEAMGVTYIDETELTQFAITDGDVRLSGQRRGEPVELRASFVVDASGPRGFLFRSLGLTETRWPEFPATQAFYSHFTGVKRWDEFHPSEAGTPYPTDDAALHHVFPGGWMWVLRFNNGLTSAGVSVSDELARELQFGDGAAAWRRLLERFPSVAAQFQSACPVREFTWMPRVTFRCAEVAGDRWTLLPSAAGFVDPLLSTGFPLTLLGVERLARLFAAEKIPSAQALAHYAADTRADLDAAAVLVGALHHNLSRPAVFQSLTLLYFAAAIFAEAARRLGRPQLASGFLLRDHPRFGPATEHLARQSRAADLDPGAFQAAVAAAIDPINVAGLGRLERRNWYPVDTDALQAGASKLGSNREELTAMLRRSGFTI